MILAFSLSDIIRVPFGYLLDILYQLTTNYGIALILFSLLLKLIMMPMNAKSKRSTMAMSRLAPLAQAIQAKYPDNQAKANQEIQKLYKEEGVSMGSGCLWMLIPLLLLFPLYVVIREPLTYMLHFTREQSAEIVAAMKALIPDAFGKNTFYHQLITAAHLSEYSSQILETIPELANRANEGFGFTFMGIEFGTHRAMESLNFNFLGIDLTQIPSWKVWKWELNWNTIGAFLIPVSSAAVSILSMTISQKMNAKVATNEDGEVDEAAAKQVKNTNKTMMLISPIMSLWIGFSYPCSLSLYWLCQGLFGMIQDIILTKRYRKLYADEDEIRRRVAAERAAAEAEKERIRAQRRAENPDGITTNTSKKKLHNMQQAQKEQSQAAARRGSTPDPDDEDAPLSGDPDRPFAKGRAYRADRYGTDAED